MVPRSFKTSALAVVLLPRIVTSPVTVVAPELTVPIVLITVDPFMTADPVTVPPFSKAFVRDLLVRVSTVLRPTNVSVVVGSVRVPVFFMALIVG